MAAMGQRVFGAAASCALLLLLHQPGLTYAETTTTSATSFFSELSACPASCGSASPRDWTVYPSVSRLSFCQEPMLFDLNLYNPIKDSSSGSNVRACTVGGGSDNTKSTRRETSDGDDDVDACSPSVAPTTTALEFGLRGPAAAADAKDTTSALNHLQEYLGSSTDCTKRIMLGASNGTIVGVYAGGAFSKTAAQAVIQEIQSRSQLGGASSAASMMTVQLCGGPRDRHHVLGAAVSLDGDIAAVQATLAAWNNGTCAGGFDKVETLSPIEITEVPQHRRNATASLTSSNLTTHHQQANSQRPSGHLLSRAASGYCTTRTVEDGDSCWSLSNACGISLDEFYKFTPADKCSSLQKGQKVCCDKGSLKPLRQDNGTCYTHTVEAGDNCYEIGLPWTLSMQDVADLNDKKTWGWSGCGNLPVGLQICLSEAPAELSNAVCGPQKPGTKFDGPVTDTEALAHLNPCPLNSCCNIWGQCGIDESFCTVSTGPTENPGTSQAGVFGCISNCGTDIVGNDSPPAQFQRVGYYETYNWGRECLHQRAAGANTIGYTHMHWAFGSVDMDMNVFIEDQYGQWKDFMALKDVKKIASFGGWGFSTEVATYAVLRAAMAPERRQSFVASLVAFVQESGVDGIDFDWEYPGAPDIPGIPAGQPSDPVNYLATLKDLRNALPDHVSISIAAPASFWYLRPFPIKDISEVVDYIVFMSYDLHGQWDYGSTWASQGCAAGNCLRSHVNQTEVLLGLSMITKAGVSPTKIMVGESSYGRSFNMASADCTGPTCLYTGSSSQSDATPGRCTNTGGYLANAEINEIIADTSRSVKSWHDDETASDYLVYDDLQWVAYMSSETKEARREKWKNLNFLGTIDWATDLQEFSSADSLGPSGDYDQDVCVNVFDNMIWDWVNPAVAAPVNCTNLLQPSPLPSVVTLTAFTTITFVSGGQVSTRDISTAFPVSEVNFQPFTVGDADVVDGSVLVYHPVPRVTADPIKIQVPPGWTVTSAGGKPGETPPSATTIGLPHQQQPGGGGGGASNTATTTSTSSDAAGFLLIPWLPTVSYPLPPMVTPKIVAPTSLPPDDRRPVPAPPVPNVKDCTGAGCGRGDDCVGDDCIRGGDCIGSDCTVGGLCRGPACVRGGQCIGDKCTEGGGCEGDGCVEGGGCSGPSCNQGGGCKGSGCNKGGDCVQSPLQDCGSGGCTGPNCGCVGMWCANRITIDVLPPMTKGPEPPKARPTCLTGCPTLPRDKPCNLQQCPPGRMPTAPRCTAQTAARDCTEEVSSMAVQTVPTTSWSTTTRTYCDTTMGCDGRDRTTTTTVTTSEEPAPTVSMVEYWSLPEVADMSPADHDAMVAEFDEWLEMIETVPEEPKPAPKPDPQPDPQPEAPPHKPDALCRMWDAYAAWQFQIILDGWGDESKLRKEEGGCGAMAVWEWHKPTVALPFPNVIFSLPFLMKSGCVERAIVSAGGPKIECEKMGAVDAPSQRRRRRHQEAVLAQMRVVEKPRPFTAEEMARMTRVYGPVDPGVVPQYETMHWNTTGAANATSGDTLLR
ncbi:glycoside hydrolase [Apiospora saccharicola]|uniref:chitinase n=1 Tax=Apiospora saccharicola TaxID=335842 RepID=A0ABR1UGX1_9PEZI